MSERASMSMPSELACSGLMYVGVPIICPYSVKSVFSVSRWLSALATPKSITTGVGLPSTSDTRIFEGLTSRWTIPLLCAC